jgi:hypothetical protein
MYMESSDSQPQSGSGEIKPVTSVPFEVVRQAEFVFEPFMGSLIQLPAARMQRAQSSEFFLAESPAQTETLPTSVEAEVGEGVVWERPLALSQASTSAVPPWTEPRPAFPAETPREKTGKIANEQEGPRFYQPQTVRFFDPVAGATEHGEGADVPEELGPRSSTQLSPELRAAILRIDEQRRQMQQPEKPAKEKKRGFLKSKAKTADVHEAPLEIVNPRNVKLTERAARWEEISALQPAAAHTASDVKPANEPVTAANARPAAADSEQIGAMNAASAATPATASPAAVPTGDVAATPEVIPAWQAIPMEEAVPRHEEASTPDAIPIHTSPPPQTLQPEEIVPTSAQEAVAAREIVSTPQRVRIEEAVRPPQTVLMSEAATLAVPAEEPPAAPVGQTTAPSEQATERVRENAPLPVVFAANSATIMPVEEEQKAAALEPPSTKRVRGIAAALARVRRADLVGEPVESPIPQTPFVEEPWEEEEERPLEEKEKISLSARLQRWLAGEAPKLDGNRRRAERVIMPGLVAFYWSGGSPRPHEIVNISKTGFYMKTTEFWALETLLRMTLQRPSSEKKPTGESISVLARVVRIDESGVGHEFVTTEALIHARSMDVMPSRGTDWRELDKFLRIQ